MSHFLKKIKESGGQQGQQFYSISNVIKNSLGYSLLLIVLVGRRIPLFIFFSKNEAFYFILVMYHLILFIPSDINVVAITLSQENKNNFFFHYFLE